MAHTAAHAAIGKAVGRRTSARPPKPARYQHPVAPIHLGCLEAVVRRIFAPVVRLSLHENDDQEEHRRKVVLIPMSLCLTTFAISGLVAEIASDMRGNLTQALFLVVAAISASSLAAVGIMTKRVGCTLAQSWLACCLFLSCVSDILHAGSYELWLLAVVALDGVLLVGNGSTASWLRNFLFVYVVLRSADDAERFGMHGWIPNKSPMPARGWQEGSVILATRISFLLLDYAVTARVSRSMRVEATRLEAATALAEDLAWALVRFDLDLAEELLLENDESELDPLRIALENLLANLRLYRPYVPESLFCIDDDRAFGDDDANVVVSFEQPLEATVTIDTPQPSPPNASNPLVAEAKKAAPAGQKSALRPARLVFNTSYISEHDRFSLATETWGLAATDIMSQGALSPKGSRVTLRPDGTVFIPAPITPEAEVPDIADLVGVDNSMASETTSDVTSESASVQMKDIGRERRLSAAGRQVHCVSYSTLPRTDAVVRASGRNASSQSLPVKSNEATGKDGKAASCNNNNNNIGSPELRITIRNGRRLPPPVRGTVRTGSPDGDRRMLSQTAVVHGTTRAPSSMSITTSSTPGCFLQPAPDLPGMMSSESLVLQHIKRDELKQADDSICSSASPQVDPPQELVSVGSEQKMTLADLRNRRAMMSPRTVHSPRSLRSMPRAQDSRSSLLQDDPGIIQEKRRLKQTFDDTMRARKASVLIVKVDLLQSPCYTSSVFALAAAFVRKVVTCARDYGGCVLDFTPSQVMITWNTHRPVVKHALQACRCALALAEVMQGLNPPGWSIAVACGQLFVGHLGTERMRAPCIEGEPLVQARSLLSLAKLVRSRVLVTEAVRDRVTAHMDLRIVDIIPSDPDFTMRRGMVSMNSICVFQLCGVLNGNSVQGVKQIEYSEAFALFSVHRYEEATQKLNDYLASCPRDVQAQRLLDLTISAVNAERLGKYLFPNPYVRPLVGWKDFEMALEAPMSPEVESVHAPSLRGDLPSLRQEVERAQLKRNPSQSSASDSESSSSDTDELAMEFKDREGNRWWRSNKMLGRGAVGAVYLGLGDDGALVALKAVRVPTLHGSKNMKPRLRPSACKEPEIDDLLAEVQMLSTLSHDNIVSYIGSAVVSNHIVISMECVPAGSLQTVLNEFGTIPTPSVKRYTRDIVRGLLYLHDNSVAHRDLKPGNVLLMNDGQCKLSDFGTAAKLSKVAQKTDGMPVGTPLFMSPEACRGEASMESDIWALGITICQMLTGEVPYPEWVPEGVAFIWRLSRCDPECLPVVPDLGDSSALGLINKCLNTNKDERPRAKDLVIHPFVVR